MRKFFHQPFRWAAVYSLLLIASMAMVLLDTFVIPRAGTVVVTETTNAAAGTTATSDRVSGATNASTTGTAAEAVITDSSYQDENIQITIEKYFAYDTWIYVADIQVSSLAYLKTAFADSTYGRNIKETTSSMAESNNAILAINGDYYGFRDDGFVLRNGVLYRDTASAAGDDEALLIDGSGNFSIINENQADAQALVEAGAWQILSFGPALINNGQIIVSNSSEVNQAMTSNPRTAIGQISDLHDLIVVSDGRTSESAGLSLLELAQVFADHGCTVAYNLDGGGSTTLWFNGEIINNPVGGKSSSSSQRKVSDIVYIGY
jgi:exopolysaccharide biosynthesis protein